MNRHYTDILSRIAEKPKWFDENAVPRFDDFHPSLAANIYADECVLLRVTCQACGRRFDVCLSQSDGGRAIAAARGEAHVKSLAEEIRERAIDYGDPPNVECCAAGPTMSSVSDRVLQYWRKTDDFAWVRDASLEVDVYDEEGG